MPYCLICGWRSTRSTKRREDQTPSWIQSEEEGPSVPATNWHPHPRQT